MASVAPSQSAKVATVEFEVLGMMCGSCVGWWIELLVMWTGLALWTLELIYQWSWLKLTSWNQLRQ